MWRRRSRIGQARRRWVDRGQVRGEVVEPGAVPVTGAAAMRGGEPVEVGHRNEPRSAAVASSAGQSFAQQAGRVHRLAGEHAEMEHHLPGGVGGAAVMAAGFRSAVSAVPGGQQVVESLPVTHPAVGRSDGSPADHLRCGGAAGAFGEAEFLRGGRGTRPGPRLTAPVAAVPPNTNRACDGSDS